MDGTRSLLTVALFGFVGVTLGAAQITCKEPARRKR